jgi:hypothetical protein
VQGTVLYSVLYSDAPYSTVEVARWSGRCTRRRDPLADRVVTLTTRISLAAVSD